MKLLFVLLLFFVPSWVSAAEGPTAYFFWRDGCRYCEAQKPEMTFLQERYNLDVRAINISKDPPGREVLKTLIARLDFEAPGVPITVIGSKYWIGYSPGQLEEMIQTIEYCRREGCQDPMADDYEHVEIDALMEEAASKIQIPWVGEVDLAKHSLLFSTILISFVDGFNPCSLWVLSILLALVLNVGSRKRVLLVGLVFLSVTSLVYGLFMLGLFKVFGMLAWISSLNVVVALLAAGFGLVNVKDYFWFQKGLSFTISDKHKPGIYKKIRKVMASKDSPWAMLMTTVAMALGISLMELPCTAGFPVIWTNMVASHDVGTGTFLGLFAVYMLVYLFDELLIFGAAVITLRASKMQDKHGRILKLIGGVVMLTLALVLLIKPELMHDLTASIAVFGAAFVLTALILVLHRVILPRFGVRVGSEDLGEM